MAIAAQPFAVSVPVSTGPGVHAVAVTPSDTTVYNPPLRALWVGSGGPLAIVAVGDTAAVTLTAVPIGLFEGCVIQRVMATNTSASLIIGFY